MASAAQPTAPFVPAAAPPATSPAAPTEAPTTNSIPIRPVSLLGAALVIGGAFLGWISTFGVSAHSFDIALPFLIDYQTTASDSLSIGLLVLVLAAAAAVLAVIPSIGNWIAALQFLGGSLIIMVVASVVQLVLATDSTGTSFIDLTRRIWKTKFASDPMKSDLALAAQ